MAAVRAGCVPSRILSQTGSRTIALVINTNKAIPDCLDPWLDASPNIWALENHYYVNGYVVCMSIQTDDSLFRSGLLASPARVAALSESRGHCLNCHDDTNLFKQSTHPFPNLGGIWNPEL